MTKPAWRCPQCQLDGEEDEIECVACGTLRPGKEKPKIEPTIQFGGLAMPVAESSPVLCHPPVAPTPIFGGGPVTKEPPNGAAVKARYTFGSSELCAGTPISSGPSYIQNPRLLVEGMATPRKSDAVTEIVPRRVPPTLKVGGPTAGVVYNWGSAECDQLAVRQDLLDEFNVRAQPVIIKRLMNPIATAIACGALHSAAIVHRSKMLYTWGCNDGKALGRPIRNTDDPSAESSVWRKVPPPSEEKELYGFKAPGAVWGLPEGVELLQVSAGDSHTSVLTKTGEVWSWGSFRDYSGPLGFPNFSAKSGTDVLAQAPVPAPVCRRMDGLAVEGVAIEVVSGENHCGVLTALPTGERRVYLFGSNEFGQCGRPPPKEGANEDERRMCLYPVELRVEHTTWKQAVMDENGGLKKLRDHDELKKIQMQGTFLHIYAGKCTTFLTLDIDGVIRTFGFGRNFNGEVGIGAISEAVDEPTEIRGLSSSYRWAQIAGGDNFTVGLGTDGSVFTWGDPHGCAQGDISNNVLAPRVVPSLRQSCAAVTAGSKSAFALTKDGQVLGWGDNNCSQLTGPSEDQFVMSPRLISLDLFEEGFISAMAAGAQHALSLVVAFEPPVESESRQRLKRMAETKLEPLPKRARLAGLEVPTQPFNSDVEEEATPVRKITGESAVMDSAVTEANTEQDRDSSAGDAPLSSQLDGGLADDERGTASKPDDDSSPRTQDYSTVKLHVESVTVATSDIDEESEAEGIDERRPHEVRVRVEEPADEESDELAAEDSGEASGSEGAEEASSDDMASSHVPPPPKRAAAKPKGKKAQKAKAKSTSAISVKKSTQKASQEAEPNESKARRKPAPKAAPKQRAKSKPEEEIPESSQSQEDEPRGRRTREAAGKAKSTATKSSSSKSSAPKASTTKSKPASKKKAEEEEPPASQEDEEAEVRRPATRSTRRKASKEEDEGVVAKAKPKSTRRARQEPKSRAKKG